MQFTCFSVSATLLDMSSFGIPNSLSACWVIKISAYTFRITVTFNLFRILKFVLVVGNCVYALENFFCSFFTPSGDVPDYCPFIKSVFTLLYSLFKFLKPLWAFEVKIMQEYIVRSFMMLIYNLLHVFSEKEKECIFINIVCHYSPCRFSLCKFFW